MSKYIQYADTNLYFHNHCISDMVNPDTGYTEHDTIQRSGEYKYTANDLSIPCVLLDMPEIVDLCNTNYHPERLPSNGSSTGMINGKSISSLHGNHWDKLAQAHIYNIGATRRWRKGYNPDMPTGRQLSESRLKGEIAKQERDASYKRRQAKRLQALRKRRA